MNKSKKKAELEKRLDELNRSQPYVGDDGMPSAFILLEWFINMISFFIRYIRIKILKFRISRLS